MIKIRLLNVHPISNPNGPEDWDGKAHTVPTWPGDWKPGLLRDEALAELAKSLAKAIGFTANLDQGHSRYRAESDEVFLFPRRYTTGTHCIIVQRASSKERT